MVIQNDWEQVQAAVQRIIDQGRVGSPVVVRCLTHTAGGRGQVADQMGAIRDAAIRWFGGDPIREYTAGSEDRGHVVASLRWPGGQSAIVGVGVGDQNAGVGGSLILLGSRGAMYYNFPVGPGRALG